MEGGGASEAMELTLSSQNVLSLASEGLKKYK